MPKDLIFIVKFHDFAKWVYTQITLLMIYDIWAIHDWYTWLFHDLFLKLRTYAMSWILLLWVDDFRMIWDKSHDLSFSTRSLIIEYIYIYIDIWAWESRMSSMMFSWSFWYMIILQFPNYDLIFNIVNFMFLPWVGISSAFKKCVKL